MRMSVGRPRHKVGLSESLARSWLSSKPTTLYVSSWGMRADGLGKTWRSGLIADAMARIALRHPHVAFRRVSTTLTEYAGSDETAPIPGKRSTSILI